MRDIPRHSRSFDLPSVAIGARRKAPSAATKTEKSKEALTPRAIVSVKANDKSKSPLARANHRSLQPTRSPRARTVSARVAVQARTGMRDVKTNQFRGEAWIGLAHPLKSNLQRCRWTDRRGLGRSRNYSSSIISPPNSLTRFMRPALIGFCIIF